jgi:hypothetical protein
MAGNYSSRKVWKFFSLVVLLVITGCFWNNSNLAHQPVIQPVPVAPNASLITGKVVSYSIVNSKVEQVEPVTTLYSLLIEVEISESVSGLANFVKAGDVVKAFATHELSPCLFSRRVKAEVQMRGGDFSRTSFWLTSPITIVTPSEVGPPGLQACRLVSSGSD